jgi:hypothetical protein
MRPCDHCGADLPADSDPQRRYCGDACKQAAYKARRAAEALPAGLGRNLEAIENDLARYFGEGYGHRLAEASMEAARSIARALDARPGDAALWRSYKDVRAELKEQAYRQADDDQLLEVLRQISGDPNWTPHWMKETS